MSGPSLLPFDLEKQNTVLLELATQMVVPAGVSQVRPVQVCETCCNAHLPDQGLSHLLIQVDIWPSNGTNDNVTFTVIAQHTVKGVTSISQVSSEQCALRR